MFVLGSLFLFNSPDPSLRIDLWLILSVAGFTFLLIVVALAFIIKSLRSRVTTGAQGMIGKRGKTRTPLAPEGMVFLHGELWNARSLDGGPIAENAKIEVVSMEGMELIVKPIS